MDIKQFAAQHAGKKPLESKKWTMAMIGVGCVMLTFVMALLASMFKAEVAGQITILAGQVVTFLGALVGAYTTGQSFVDWKMQNTVAQAATSTREDKVVSVTERHIDIQSRAKEADYVTE